MLLTTEAKLSQSQLHGKSSVYTYPKINTFPREQMPKVRGLFRGKKKKGREAGKEGRSLTE